MKQFYKNNSIKIITVILAVVLVVMYIWLTIYSKSAYLTDPVYTRDVVEKIEIKNFIGSIELNTSENDGFRLEFTNRKETDPNGFYPLFKMGTDTIATIDGRFAPVENCTLVHNQDDVLQSAMIEETADKKYASDSYPILKITAKHDIILDVRKSVIFGFAANIGAAKFIDVNCSSFTIGKIADAAEFDLHGTTTFIVDDIGGDFSLKSTSQNTAENVLILQNIAGNAIVDLDGNTRLYAAEITGNLLSQVSGDNVVMINSVLGTETQN